MTLKGLIENKYSKLLLKIMVSVGCLYILFQKISFSEIMTTVESANSYYLVLAGVFFVISKGCSVVRLQEYLRAVLLPIDLMENMRLYWLGMFYNLFLPGGIGGDAYKAYYLHKHFADVSLKKTISVLLKDRLSGLTVLCMMVMVMSVTMNLPVSGWMLFVGVLLLSAVLFIIERKMAVDTTDHIFFTTSFSFMVQIAQLVSVLCILWALDIRQDFMGFSFVFLISTIVAMVPFTIGGIGLRELTFLYFSDYFHYDKGISVSVAFLFFFISSVLSLPGVYYHFRSDRLLNS